MALKTFNLDEETYKEFSKHCKENGISMSKKIENFIKDELERIKGKVGMPNIPRIPQMRKRELKVEEHSFSKFC